ncbi:hypothetical protein TELCIR_22693 [Teladorsagia circumcincta]|uniref:Uncharacterized protein n=1 Tax=Teladorsagia circumcincta TaxID=45464 RepID=A0A2G9TD66_TELCI|nr:hypothetical protein TELCIR_22693 [Teladorsagia circumcincta]
MSSSTPSVTRWQLPSKQLNRKRTSKKSMYCAPNQSSLEIFIRRRQKNKLCWRVSDFL